MVGHAVRRAQYLPGAARVLVMWGALAALSLALNWHNSTKPLPGPHDTLRYIEMANSLLDGNWLGDYDSLTLLRAPLYPILLSLNGALGTPLYLFQQTLYLVAFLPMLLALRRFGLTFPRLTVIWLLASVHPVALYPPTLTYGEALYTPAVTAVTAACVGLVATASASAGTRVPWLLLLWFALPVAWNARPESVWLLPPLGYFFGCYVWQARAGLVRSGTGRLGRTLWLAMVAFLVPAAMTLGFQAWVRGQNGHRYGVGVTHELAEPNFERAMKGLVRLVPEAHRPYVPINARGLQAAYQVSPAFAKIEPYMAGHFGGQGWSRYGCATVGICDEITGGWMWAAIRNAAAEAEVHRSARHARDFYRAVADDLDRACEANVVPCSNLPVLSILTPPLRASHVPLWLGGAMRVLRMTLGFEGLERHLAGIAALPSPAAAVVAKYERITHDQGRPWRYLGRFAGAQLAVFAVIQWVGLLGVLAAFLTHGVTRGGAAARRLWPWMDGKTAVIVLGFLVLVAGRVMLLGYLDALSFKTYTRYVLVVYPILAVLAGLGLPVVPRPRQRGS